MNESVFCLYFHSVPGECSGSLIWANWCQRVWTAVTGKSSWTERSSSQSVWPLTFLRRGSISVITNSATLNSAIMMAVDDKLWWLMTTWVLPFLLENLTHGSEWCIWIFFRKLTGYLFLAVYRFFVSHSWKFQLNLCLVHQVYCVNAWLKLYYAATSIPWTSWDRGNALDV